MRGPEREKAATTRFPREIRICTEVDRDPSPQGEHAYQTYLSAGPAPADPHGHEVPPHRATRDGLRGPLAPHGLPPDQVCSRAGPSAPLPNSRVTDGAIHRKHGLLLDRLRPDHNPALFRKIERRVRVHRRVTLSIELADDQFFPVHLLADDRESDPATGLVALENRHVRAALGGRGGTPGTERVDPRFP